MRFYYEFEYDAGRRVLVVSKRPSLPDDANAGVITEIPMGLYPELAKVFDSVAVKGRWGFSGLERFFGKLWRIARLEGRRMVGWPSGLYVTARKLERLGVNKRRLRREVRRLKREVWRRAVLARLPVGAIVCKVEWKPHEYPPVPRWLRRRAYSVVDLDDATVYVFKQSVLVDDKEEDRVTWFGFHYWCNFWDTIAELARELKEVLKDDRKVARVLGEIARALAESRKDLDAETLAGLLATVGV